MGSARFFTLILCLFAFGPVQAKEADPCVAALSLPQPEIRTDAELVEARKIWGLLETFWQKRLEVEIEPSILVIYKGETNSDCGPMLGVRGLQYCPADGKTYLDFDWWKLMETKFGAAGVGARVYALAHEYAHHIQHKGWDLLLPIYDMIGRQAAYPLRASHISVCYELWADALAGTFFGHLYLTGRMNRQEIAEGLNAAAKMGDDNVYKIVFGEIRKKGHLPSHGTDEQRRSWMRKGLYARNANEINPFLDKQWNLDQEPHFVRWMREPFQAHIENPPF